MCLINELARYNKLSHQYRLTDESGPAHKKTFTVCLKLGTDFSAEDDPDFFAFVIKHKIPRLPEPPASKQSAAQEGGVSHLEKYLVKMLGRKR